MRATKKNDILRLIGGRSLPESVWMVRFQERVEARERGASGDRGGSTAEAKQGQLRSHDYLVAAFGKDLVSYPALCSLLLWSES